MPIDSTQLRPNQDILVSGVVSWSHVTSLIEGKELEARIANSTSSYPTKVPHTAITIHDAEIIPAGNGLTLEEQYVQEKFYRATNQDRYHGFSYGIENKSQILPTVFRKGDPAAGEVEKELYQVKPDGEIAAGVPVILLLHTFTSEQYHRTGLGLNAVIVRQSSVPTFQASNPGARIIENALGARGLTVHFDSAIDAEPTVAAVPAQPQDVMGAQMVAPVVPEAPVAAAPVVPEMPTFGGNQTGITLESIL